MADSATQPGPPFHFEINDFPTFIAFVQMVRGLGTDQETATLAKVVTDLQGARLTLQAAINKAANPSGA